MLSSSLLLFRGRLQEFPGVVHESILNEHEREPRNEGGIRRCAPEDERSQAEIPDQFRHEIATAYNLKGKGLVVLTSCSHRGVVNIVKQAQADDIKVRLDDIGSTNWNVLTPTDSAACCPASTQAPISTAKTSPR
jgi:hypothetical protein